MVSFWLCLIVVIYAELWAKLGLFEYEEYISLKTINDPNEGYVCRLSRYLIIS